MRAPFPEGEQQRLKAVADYDYAAEPEDTDFADIVALASAICETRVALVSLVDEDRQWFKAGHGTDLTDTSRDEAICGHALLQDDILEIEDTIEDPRTSDNRMIVHENKLRFYAGAQLRTPKGLPIGTLCVLDDKPRRLTDLQRQALRTLADQVMTQLELRRTLRNQEILRQEMDHRVKNSLQTVQSLIRLYSGKVKDTTAQEAFSAVDRRLTAVIALHKELHQSSSVAQIRVQPFLRGILSHLRETCPPDVVIEAEVADFELASTEATALAVVLSECVANAIKHAFPQGRAGRISIECCYLPDGTVRMRCRDDGVGEGAAEPTSMTSLGQRIMRASAQQIAARLTRDEMETGYSVTMTFKPVTRA
ncbi:GAF domain-containing protein [Salipiger sp. IMCC34102]|uniref:sensor histidine kinase n=1 Tax=Salipiger sp. IMCC34102 TaxID=2510647 RepID=UPI00101DBEF6|nr:histidine kinase dimerization/phosphoacceptor domain -containing protein [Salipiger sp. IMCC34102]RYH03958.1 GAF domain-containing protein [Salipiger sp. IMCC34102]